MVVTLVCSVHAVERDGSDFLLEAVNNIFAEAEDMLDEGQVMIDLIVLEIERKLFMRDSFRSKPSRYGSVWIRVSC